MKTIEQLLGLPALMGIVEETTNGLPQERFLPSQFKTLTRDVIGNSAEAVLQKGQRKVSKLIKYNAPPVGAPLETIATTDWILFHTSEELPIDPVTFQRLRAYDSWQIQKQGLEEIGRQIGLFVQKMTNLESTLIMYILTQGVVYINGNGDVLPTSSGATETLTMLIPSTNQGQLPAAAGSANIISAPWNNPTTNIPDQLRVLRKVAAQASGYRPEMVLYGENIPGYIQINSYCKDYLSRNPKMNAEFMESGEVPNGFLGFDWVPAYEAFYEDYTGTNRSIVDADFCGFYPKPSKQWYELVLGSMQVPTTLNIMTNVDSAMSNVDIKYGKYSYAQLENKPIRLLVVQGHTFLPTVKVPNAIWQADVVF